MDSVYICDDYIKIDKHYYKHMISNTSGRVYYCSPLDAIAVYDDVNEKLYVFINDTMYDLSNKYMIER